MSEKEIICGRSQGGSCKICGEDEANPYYKYNVRYWEDDLMSEKKKERLFVIMEVKKRENHRPDKNGRTIYDPVERDGIIREVLYLDPKSIIPESRLRYGKPKKGETYFARYNVEREEYEKEYEIRGWEEAEINKGFTALILDSEPEEKKDEWEEWADKLPFCDMSSDLYASMKNWLKRMPKRR